MHFNCRLVSLFSFVPLSSLAISFFPTTLTATAQYLPGSALEATPDRISAPSSTTATRSHGLLEPQDGRSGSGAAESVVTANLELPDAPTVQGNAPGAQPAHTARPPRFAPAPRAPLYNKYIEPGQTAQALLGVRHKVLFGLDQIVSPYYFVSIVSSAAYEQAVNGSPNYGTNIGAFGQRVGAAAATNASQSLFTDGLMPAVFHQDPRYYVRGRTHNLLDRGGYAITRVFVTRTDSGDEVPNYSLFAGHALTSSLQNAYYPEANQGASQTAKSYATSFGGTALSNAIREFFPDILHLAHLE